MPRLGKARLVRLATCITGDIDDDAVDYRRLVDLEEFFARFDDIPAWNAEGTRNTKALRFLEACNRTPLGTSRLPVAIESVLTEILSAGEFKDEARRDGALALVGRILKPDGIAVETDIDGEVQFASSASSKRQALIDVELHTAFGAVLHESELESARVHYANARNMIRAGDYPNAAKEAVCSVEAFLVTLTGEEDFKRALRVASKGGLPKPLAGVIEKLYAWRGDEPGIAHGGKTVPSVSLADAQFAVNMAVVINLYLRERLLTDERSDQQGIDELILFALP